MKKYLTVLTALVAVFLWVNFAQANPSHQPLVFSKFAAEIAAEFGEKKPENVLIVVVTKAPGNMAYVVVIMKNGHGFKWVKGPYATAIRRIRAVVNKNRRLNPASGKIEL